MLNTFASQCRGGCLIVVVKRKNYSSERGETLVRLLWMTLSLFYYFG